MDYLEYLETAWIYLPYIIYTYVFLTLVPKSFLRIKRFADADYDAKRNTYHRCYGPEHCCHNNNNGQASKQKPRKAVTRVYPKRQNSETKDASAALPHNVIKRQVPVSAIQTRTNVNQIARMFETGASSKKINRVMPTVLPDIRMYMADEQDRKERAAAHTLTQLQMLLQQQEDEQVENSLELLSHMTDASNVHNNNSNNINDNWCSEPIVQMRKRTLNSVGGSSATPSTASPAASSPRSSSPEQISASLLRRVPLNMKSSLEDIYEAIARNAEKPDHFIYAGCKSLAPVTSIDDILSQRRLSRPLSAYSISDLLNEENSATEAATDLDETYVDNFICVLNKS